MLDSKYQFRPSYCDGIEDCIFDLLMNKNVSALLVPYADVLTASTFHVLKFLKLLALSTVFLTNRSKQYAVDKNLASRPCGSPIRTVGDPILVDLVPSAKLCIYSEVSFNQQS
jgi:hypothetical protein